MRTLVVVDLLISSLLLQLGVSFWLCILDVASLFQILTTTAKSSSRHTNCIINTKTNQVTATLRVRPGPAEVTVSTAARPRILEYSFQAFDAPGSISTFPEAVNNRGQVVGMFTDTGGVVHGFLRQLDGSFVTIDPPNSVFSNAIGINDVGTIVGFWQPPGGAFHGFTRSPSGSYTTVDFPGAVDSAQLCRSRDKSRGISKL